eukprot:6617893-Alexandrium_andersonii.AAC.1
MIQSLVPEASREVQCLQQIRDIGGAKARVDQSAKSSEARGRAQANLAGYWKCSNDAKKRAREWVESQGIRAVAGAMGF